MRQVLGALLGALVSFGASADPAPEPVRKDMLIFSAPGLKMTDGETVRRINPIYGPITDFISARPHPTIPGAALIAVLIERHVSILELRNARSEIRPVARFQAVAPDVFFPGRYFEDGLFNVGDTAVFHSTFYESKTRRGRGVFALKNGKLKRLDTSNGRDPLTFAEEMRSVGGKAYFIGTTARTGDELWVTDGTNAGTSLLKDIRRGKRDGEIAFMGELDGKLIFTARDVENGREIWISDGTPDGTRLLKDVNPGPADGIRFTNFVVHDGLGYFYGISAKGSELWSTDGTEAGTKLVADLRPGESGSGPLPLLSAQNHLYFEADLGDERGRALYRLKSPQVSPKLAFDWGPGDFARIEHALRFRDGVAFTATREFKPGQYRYGVYFSDGTEAGSRVITDFSDFPPTFVSRLTLVGSRIFGDYGSKIFMSDGTAEGFKFIGKDDSSGGFSLNGKYVILTWKNALKAFDQDGNVSTLADKTVVDGEVVNLAQ